MGITPEIHRETHLPTMIVRLRDISSTYRHLELGYSKLPLSNRRYLYGNCYSEVKLLRLQTEARFLVASVLQWNPSNYGFRLDQLAADGGGEIRNESDVGTDLCPIWMNFFHEVLKVDRILCGWYNNCEQVPDLHFVDGLLCHAEAKVRWVQDMLNNISDHRELMGQGAGLPLQMPLIFEGWNRFCLRIARGATLESISASLRLPGRSNGFEKVRYALPAVLTADVAEQRRIWFPFEPPSSFDPWIGHALNIISPPEFDAKTATMDEKYSFYFTHPPEQHWKLLYKHDPSLPEFHPECALDSPCRRPLNFCVHKVRGEDCPNTSCMYVSWSWPCVSRKIKETQEDPASLALPSTMQAPSGICEEVLRRIDAERLSAMEMARSQERRQ